ncbi:hypothetical protein PsorP6_008531 [Peronosclerospora sorghi]|uniref:Uncharacterized protein n=1 Tax=Peronosclerospora sorghi TaxID=230839 RepID=A0ACC0WAJ2_9STRA|nr:hypothetical protein PsorP6_008531 [Peronosclerospora sorghi]
MVVVLAMVYGRQGGLYKKKFHLLDLWECKVEDDVAILPGVLTPVTTSNNAFCFYSPLKSFILLTETQEDKVGWTSDIRECIDRNLSGKTHPRRTSLRSELLMDNDDESSSSCELESGFAIKNGWLNVFDGAVVSESDESSTNGSPTTSTRSTKFRRLWITLTLQTISLGSTFKTTQPEETVPIELCLVASLKNETWFRLQFPSDVKLCTQTTYVFESLSLAERDEWVRALKHCISGGDELALRRRSLKTATLAPIFMFDKISNVCTICTQTFIVYRPRHHCRLCGSLVCGNCSRRRWTLSYSSSTKASRVCDSCASHQRAATFPSVKTTYSSATLAVDGRLKNCLAVPWDTLQHAQPLRIGRSTSVSSMPLFSRSSERKSLRLSLRKHLHHDIDTNVDAVSRINSGHTIQAGKKPRRQTQLGRVTEQTMVVPSTTGTINIGSRQVPPPKLSISVGSSASTLRSTTPILHENVSSRRNSIPLRSSAAYASSNVNFHESYRLLSNSIKEEGNSLGKLLHPRRSRKRLELLKQREEAQKREMEQFREFIRTTEMRITTAQNTDTLMSAAEQMKAKSVLVELADPLLPESLVHLSPLELIQLICILRKSGREQEMQLEEAKNLVSAAIEAREDAEATAREAVELMAVLDSKLDRAVHEEQKLVQKLSVAGELRHSSELGDASGRSSTLQVGTPASPGAIE